MYHVIEARRTFACECGDRKTGKLTKAKVYAGTRFEAVVQPAMPGEDLIERCDLQLTPFTEGDDPDVVFESHSHWAVGYLDGFSMRVYRPDGSITPAFEEWCRIKEALEQYPILNESDYSEREYEATLENYRNEMWSLRDQLPEGWESEVYGWFSDHCQCRYTENRDDQGGYAPREKIIEALQDLGFLPAVVVET